MPMNSLDAAERVLREAGQPLRYEEITKRVVERSLWTTNGQTPAATINAQLSSDVKRHGERSRFVRCGRGVYGLRDAGSPLMASPAPSPKSTGLESTRTGELDLTNLRSVIKRVRGVRKGLSESDTRRFLVEPVLMRLGWNSPDVMQTELRVGFRKKDIVDIALLSKRRKIKVMVEVKPDEASLDKHEQQLRDYCRLEEVSLGVLTSGRRWRLYYGMHTSQKDCRAGEIDISQDDHTVASQMEKFLSRSNIYSGEAAAAFKKAWEQRIKTPQWNKVLQEQWNGMRSRVESQLAKALEKSSDKTIPADFVRAFVHEQIFLRRKVALDTAPSVPKGPMSRPQTIPRRKQTHFSASRQRPAPEARPEAIEVFGKLVSVKSWREILLVFLGEVYKSKRKEFLDKVVNRRTRKFARSFEKPTSIRVPLRVGETDVWVSGHGSGETHMAVCESVREALDLPEDVLRFR